MDLRLKTLSLRNWCAVKSLDVDFHDRLTVLTGADGGLVLRAAANALDPAIRKLASGRGAPVSKDHIMQGASACEARATANTEGFRRRKLGWWIKHNGKRASASKVISDFGERLAFLLSTTATLPLVVSYGAERFWSDKASKPATKSRSEGYCLTPATGYTVFNHWFENTRLAAGEAKLKGDTETAAEFENRLQAVRCAVDTCLAAVHSPWRNLNFQFTNPNPNPWVIEDRGIEFTLAHKTTGEEKPMREVGASITALVGLCADIAYRCAKLNGILGERAAQQTTGVVLIEEVERGISSDLWRNLLPSLMEAFPRIQFIVSTGCDPVASSVPTTHHRLCRGFPCKTASSKAAGIA